MIHDTAQIDARAKLGNEVKVWNWVQVREDAEIGDNTILSKGVYIDFGVKIGKNVKIQNNVSVYHGVSIEDGALIGPHVCFTNDKYPRAITPDGTLKRAKEWEVSQICVKYGASIGANATIVSGITIGRHSMIAAGSVVTKDVCDHGLVAGVPARLIGYVCNCGRRMEKKNDGFLYCGYCNKSIKAK